MAPLVSTLTAPSGSSDHNLVGRVVPELEAMAEPAMPGTHAFGEEDPRQREREHEHEHEHANIPGARRGRNDALSSNSKSRRDSTSSNDSGMTTSSACGGSGVGGEGEGVAGSAASSSFGSITQEQPATVASSAWNASFMQTHCCCDCVPLPRHLRGGSLERSAGAPETFTGSTAQSAAFTGKSGFRPSHRRGHSTGSIAPGARFPPRTANISQPRGWEEGSTVAGSTATSTTSSNASAALAAAAASLGVDDGAASGGRVLSGGRRSGSWAGVNALDREFHRVLKAGVDVYKHCSTGGTGAWAEVVPRRLKELLSRSCPLEDENQGLVTLFLDKEGEHFCWCPPGAAQLVPDERYRLEVRRLVEVVPGDQLHPRFLSLRASGRPNPLVVELDSDELYDILSKGIVRILERNHIRATLMTDPPKTTAL